VDATKPMAAGRLKFAKSGKIQGNFWNFSPENRGVFEWCIARRTSASLETLIQALNFRARSSALGIARMTAFLRLVLTPSERTITTGYQAMHDIDALALAWRVATSWRMMAAPPHAFPGSPVWACLPPDKDVRTNTEHRRTEPVRCLSLSYPA
jgi:hypothetical protein